MKKLVNSVIMAALLSIMGWAGLEIISHAARLSAVEAQFNLLVKWTELTSSKLDRLLEK